MGHGEHVPPLLQMAGHGGTVSRKTANKKLTKLYWPSRKRSQKRLIVFLEPKNGGAQPKNFFPLQIGVPTFALDQCPHFQIRSCATGINYPSHKGVFNPLKLFLTPKHRPPTKGVNSSYTQPDRVYTILSYRRLPE